MKLVRFDKLTWCSNGSTGLNIVMIRLAEVIMEMFCEMNSRDRHGGPWSVRHLGELVPFSLSISTESE